MFELVSIHTTIDHTLFCARNVDFDTVVSIPTDFAQHFTKASKLFVTSPSNPPRNWIAMLDLASSRIVEPLILPLRYVFWHTVTLHAIANLTVPAARRAIAFVI